MGYVLLQNTCRSFTAYKGYFRLHSSKISIFIKKLQEGSEIKLLLIDDDEDDRDFFRMAVAEVDYPVHCQLATGANDGIALLAKKEFIPDYIFLDLNMPGVDGRTCLRALKSNADTKDIPVIIFTTSSEVSDMEAVKKMGAMTFMTKPPGIDQLVHHINKFLKTNITNQTTEHEK